MLCVVTAVSQGPWLGPPSGSESGTPNNEIHGLIPMSQIPLSLACESSVVSVPSGAKVEGSERAYIGLLSTLERKVLLHRIKGDTSASDGLGVARCRVLINGVASMASSTGPVNSRYGVGVRYCDTESISPPS